MPKPNSSQYALLGLLTLGEASGYDLKKRFEQSVMGFWNESYGQIYPMLRRMAAEGLVRGRTEQARGRPPRKVYTVTSAGEQALRGWLDAPAAEHSIRHELLLKLFFGRIVGRDASLEHIRRYRERLAERLDTMRVIESQVAECPAAGTQNSIYWAITLRHGVRVMEAALQWCEEAEDMLLSADALAGLEERAGAGRA